MTAFRWEIIACGSRPGGERPSEHTQECQQCHCLPQKHRLVALAEFDVVALVAGRRARSPGSGWAPIMLRASTGESLFYAWFDIAFRLAANSR